jgi:KDO2-lipid IV(A) lauroyltransferase
MVFTKKLRILILINLVKDIRSRFKAYLITTKETKTCIEENSKNGVLGLYGFASDQTPRASHKSVIGILF